MSHESAQLELAECVTCGTTGTQTYSTLHSIPCVKRDVQFTKLDWYYSCISLTTKTRFRKLFFFNSKVDMRPEWIEFYWFHQHCKDDQYHCQTDISCLYRKSIQLNAISKVILLVQDPMWFLKDLLISLPRYKTPLMIKATKWPSSRLVDIL